MSLRSISLRTLCGLGLVGLVLAGPAVAAPISFQLVYDGVPMADAATAVFMSHAMEMQLTDGNGDVTIEIGNARGYWIEVNGERLNQFYLAETMPPVIDVALVGFMQWEGGN